MAEEKKPFKAKAAKVVVLSTAIGMHPKGTVLDAAVFGAERVVQLAAQNALRHATAEEAELSFVDLDAQSVPKNEKYELQVQLNAKQALIDQLEREVQALRNIESTRAASTNDTNVNELMTRMKDNDVIIKTLQAQLAEANEKLEKAGLK